MTPSLAEIYGWCLMFGRQRHTIAELPSTKLLSMFFDLQ